MSRWLNYYIKSSRTVLRVYALSALWALIMFFITAIIIIIVITIVIVLLVVAVCFQIPKPWFCDSLGFSNYILLIQIPSVYGPSLSCPTCFWSPQFMLTDDILSSAVYTPDWVSLFMFTFSESPYSCSLMPISADLELHFWSKVRLFFT